MSNLTNKINDYLLEKVSRSKVQHLFMVSKEYLFTKMHEVSEENELLKDENMDLKKSIYGLQIQDNNILTHCEELEAGNDRLQVELLKELAINKDTKRIIETNNELHEEVDEYCRRSERYRMKSEKLEKENNTLKTQLEARTDTKYQLAYERLVEKYESLTNENKSIKDTLDVVNNVVKNVSKQNEQLKDQLKISNTQNVRLEAENKKYKEKEKVIELKKETVKHNFSKKVNNNHRVLSK